MILLYLVILLSLDKVLSSVRSSDIISVISLVVPLTLSDASFLKQVYTLY